MKVKKKKKKKVNVSSVCEFREEENELDDRED